MSLQGIDISAWQAGIDLTSVPADFVICKATQGVDYVNDDCDRAYQQAKAAGKKLGVYHYAEGSDPITEADYFLDNIQGYIHEAMLVLDWEAGDNPEFGHNDLRWCKLFCDHVASKTGVNPVIYVQASARDRLDGVGDYGLWIAQYGDDEETGYQEHPWNEGSYDCCMRQYTSHGVLPGYDGLLDLNKFYGDEIAWDKYAGATDQQPTPTPEPVFNATSQFTDTYYLSEGDGPAPVIAQYQIDCGFAGYLGSNGCILTIDSYYGPECGYACGCIQRYHGLTVDLCYGYNTDIALKTEIATIQTALNKFGYNLVIDGLAGYLSITALKDFQSKNGLVVDGICGNKTRQLLVI